MAIEHDKKPTLSRFLVERCRENEVVIFNSLNPNQPLSIERGEWEKFKGSLIDYRGSKIPDSLRSRGLLLSDPGEDSLQLEGVRKQFLDKLPRFPSTLYLVLTDACNLNCSYCPFARLNSHGQNISGMSFEVAKRAINFWVESLLSNCDPEQPCNLIFYGGEPLLNLETIKQSLGYINRLRIEKKVPNNIRFLLDTNGTLLSEEAVCLLRYWDLDVTVALDGFSETNDRYRRDLNNRGTYRKVVKALELLKKYGVNTYLSVALTPDNLEEVVQFGPKLREYGIKGLGMNILRGSIPQDAFSCSFAEFDSYQTKSAEAMIEFFWGNMPDGITEFQTHRRFSAFTSGSFNQNNCGGFGEHIVVFPNGEIGNCPWSSNYNTGSVFESGQYSSIQSKNFFFTRKNDLPLYNEECLGCGAVSICGGNCIWAKDQSQKISDAFCVLSRSMLDSLVWKYRTEIR